MSRVKVAIIVAVAIAVLAVAYISLSKTPRDKAIDKAVMGVFKIKMRHHNLIVKALEDGATEAEHIALLEEKRVEVLEAMRRVEEEFNIVIDKNNPTEVGPVVVLER